MLFFNRLRRYQTGSSHPDSSPAACPVSWFTTCSCLNYRPPVSQRTIWLRCLLWSWPTPVCAGVAPLAKPHCFSNSPPTPPPPLYAHTHAHSSMELCLLFVTKTHAEGRRTISAHSSVFSHRNGTEQKIVGHSSAHTPHLASLPSASKVFRRHGNLLLINRRSLLGFAFIKNRHADDRVFVCFVPSGTIDRF